MMNDTDLVYIVKEVEAQSKYVFKYGFEPVNKEKADVIVNDLYKIENINKPIKCESAYKVQDLIDIERNSPNPNIDLVAKLMKFLNKGLSFLCITPYTSEKRNCFIENLRCISK